MNRVELLLYLDRLVAPDNKYMITPLSDRELAELKTQIDHLFMRLAAGDRFPARAAFQTEDAR